MKRAWAILAISCCLAVGWQSPASAQYNGNGQLGTTVQLPTFSFFSVSTTVLAPDSGAGYAAGMRRAGTVRPHYGHPLVRNHGLGNFRDGSGMSVAVQGHDMRWMDEMLLGRVVIVDPQPDEQGLAARSEFAQQIAGETADNSATASFGSMHINDIKRAKAAKEAAKNAEAEEYVVKAEAARKEGKLGMADYYLKLASVRASGDRKREIDSLIRDVAYEKEKAKSGGGK